jgi:sulfofructose kinase
MSSADASRRKAPRVLCAGIIVLDEVFRVEEFPAPDTKVEAKGFFVVNGGCAANAAVAMRSLRSVTIVRSPLASTTIADSAVE